MASNESTQEDKYTSSISTYGLNIESGKTQIDKSKKYRISAWSVFKRVDYLRRRFRDLHQRFSRTVGVFSKDFHDMPVLEQIYQVFLRLESPPKLVVYGDYDLIKGYKTLEEEGDEVCVQGYLEVHVLCKEDNYIRTKYDIGQTSPRDIHIHIRRIKFLNRVVPPLDDPSDEALTARLETIVEKHIVHGFELIYSYLEQFLTSINTTLEISKNTIYLKVFGDAIKYTILDNDLSTLSDPSGFNVLDNICQKIHCYLVPIYSLQNNIPVRVCHTLLWKFTSTMRKSASSKIKEELFGVKKSMEKKKITHKKRKARDTEDLVAYLTSELLKEFRDELEKVEHNLETARRVTTVMKKMTFEIGGHLKRALIKSDKVPTNNTYPKISESLRLNISKTEGVYAVGIVFGELQILLNPDVQDFAGVKKKIDALLKDHRYGYPYKVQILDKYPKLFSRQGDKCIGTNSQQTSTGTIGCFVKDNNNVPHLITCAHVVNQSLREILSVLIEPDNGIPYHFGYITRQKTISCGSHQPYPLVDIAAVTSMNDEQIMSRIDYRLRDDNGMSKPVSFLTELTDDLVGETVYKYGAETGLTQGIIASFDLTIEAQALLRDRYYLAFIEPLPVEENNVAIGEPAFAHDRQANVINYGNFAQEGDSGSVICIDEGGTITAAFMLTGGDYTMRGEHTNDTTKQCVGFLLARGFEKLCKNGRCHFVM